MSSEIKPMDSKSLSSFIWSVANDLWGDFKHTDFGEIIFPLLLLRRLECVLEDSKEDVLEAWEGEKNSGVDPDLLLPPIAGYNFYNASQYTLGTLGSTSTRENMEDYISKFSSNVRLIFEEFDFSNTLVRLDKAKLLYRMVNHFAGIDLHKDVVSDRVMSNTYEQLIRDFAASVNEKAGEFMTPRDAVRLTTKLVLAPDEEIFNEAGIIRSIYDPACGTLGFISDGIGQINDMSPQAKIVPFGQELDPKTHAIALTAMLIQGYDTENIKQGSTLSNDQLGDKKFHYCLANPPFGIKWAKDEKAVRKEFDEQGYAGRFGPGLPSISDGSMLFLMHLVSKMEDPKNGGGRTGIVLSGSPLFNGDAGSGPSEIRRWLLENDYVEAILALPTDMFFNTGIGTYVWILTNKKAPERKGKVQLINLSDTWTQMRKSEGSKRRFISEDQINDIAKEYEYFSESKITKIFDYTDFAYRKVTIQRPLRAGIFIDQKGIDGLKNIKPFAKLKPEEQDAWRQLLTDNLGRHGYDFLGDLLAANQSTDGRGKAAAGLKNALIKCFIVRDEEAEVVIDKHGQPVVDTELKDTENIPFNKDVEEYFNEEVLPHVPDAFIDHSVRDEKDGEVGIVGYEINFNRYFYEYVEPRPLADIDTDLKASEKRIQALLDEVAE